MDRVTSRSPLTWGALWDCLRSRPGGRLRLALRRSVSPVFLTCPVCRVVSSGRLVSLLCTPYSPRRLPFQVLLPLSSFLAFVFFFSQVFPVHVPFPAIVTSPLFCCLAFCFPTPFKASLFYGGFYALVMAVYLAISFICSRATFFSVQCCFISISFSKNSSTTVTRTKLEEPLLLFLGFIYYLDDI